MADEAFALGARAADRLTVPSNAAVAAAKQVARVQREISTELRDRPTVAERAEARAQALEEARQQRAQDEARRTPEDTTSGGADTGERPADGQRATVVNILV